LYCWGTCWPDWAFSWELAELRQLACCHRTIRVHRSSISLHFRQLRRYPATPQTLGEHLRKKRVDMQLSMTQLAKMLGIGITDTAIEKWEKNQNRPTEEHRKLIVEFLGFNPVLTNPIGDS
jgi:DNA-binding transcriptional regulator YiaG